MENNDLEHGSGDVDMIQLLLDRHVENEARHRNQSSPSIYMVPSLLRDVSPDSFNPRMVSIGPLHREDMNVQAFEGQKLRYLINLLSRIGNYSKEKIWKTCMQKAYISMKRIKACYVWPKNKNYSDVEIAEMMVIDACFILEFTYRLHVYSRREVYLKNKWQFQILMHDLVLVENQIPLFFLDEIYHCTILKFTSDLSLSKLIHRLLDGNITDTIFITTLEINIGNDYTSTADHILGFLHHCYMPPNINVGEVAHSRIHSATDLDMTGVNFKPSQDPTWVMGIEMKQYTRRFPYYFGSWSYNPTLTMPLLCVHDSTELLFRNLIAYEQSFNATMYFTSYVSTMDMLVNTQEDVAKLVNSGVLINLTGSNEEAANMINNLGKHIIVPYTFYKEEWEKVNKYCDGYWPKHIAWMRSTYLRSPWNIIALFAGIVIFVLQVVQTIFTIKSSGSNM